MCWIVGLLIAAAIGWALLQTKLAVRHGKLDTQQPETPAVRQSIIFSSPPTLQTPKPEQRRGSITWYGVGTVLRVAGIEISDPCTYASNRQRADDPSEILLGRPVAAPVGQPAPLGYWPWYSTLSPQQRWRYLQWLKSGKSALPSEEGFLFLYYYGLERRLLVEDQDQTWTVKEVLRLAALNDARVEPRAGSSFRNYSTSLLWFMVARHPDGFDTKAFDRMCARTQRWTSESATAALVWAAARKVPLNSKMAMAIARLNPRSLRSVIVDRVNEQFSELFTRRYQERFGAGILIPTGPSSRKHVYRTASSAIGSVACTIADPWAATPHLDVLPEIWNSCIDSLRPLSRIDTSETRTLTAEAWEALPPELRQGVDHPLQAPMQSMLAEADSTAGETLVPAGRLATLLGVEQRPKLTPTQCRRLAATAEATGYCVEPDFRLTNRPYDWNQRLAVFLRVDDAPTDAARYAASSCMLRLGMLIALADGTAHEPELQTLTDHVSRAFEYTPGEARRLEALRALLLQEGSELSHVSKLLERGVSTELRKGIGKLLVAIAAAHDGIDQAELVALRKCFRTLGLTASDLESTISSVAPGHDETLVTMQQGRTMALVAEDIPAPGASPVGLRLNQETIQTLMAETRDVARLLAEAMQSGGESDASQAHTESSQFRSDITYSEATDSAVQPGPATTNIPHAVPARYAPFYQELVRVDRWSRPDADALARKHGLMLDGALETINDWAFEAFATQLIEDEGQTIRIDRSLL